MLSDRFRTAIEASDVGGASRLFREDAVFRSPVVYRPHAARDTMLKILEAAERVLGASGHFHYVHQLEDREAGVAILDFATEVDGRQVKGIDRLTFDDQRARHRAEGDAPPSLGAAGSRSGDSRGICAPRAHVAGLKRSLLTAPVRGPRPTALPAFDHCDTLLALPTAAGVPMPASVLPPIRHVRLPRTGSPRGRFR